MKANTTPQTEEIFAASIIQMPVFIYAIEEYEKLMGKLNDAECNCCTAA